MALTKQERERIEELEESARQLAQLLKGGGSKNQLNRLLVLAQDKNRKLIQRVENLEEKQRKILELVRKLQ